MATWTTIPDSSLEPGKPIRSIDTLALRDNPVAIAEAAPGAPPVSLAAIVAALASVPVGSIGSYAFLRPTATTDYAAGSTLAGSSLRYSAAVTGVIMILGVSTSAIDGGTPSGTWRCMGHRQARNPNDNGNLTVATSAASTIWLRIA